MSYSRPFRLSITPKRVLLGFLIVVLLHTVLFGLRVDLFLPQNFASAKNTWEAKNITHYRMNVLVGGFCAPPCGLQMQLEVEQNQVIQASERPGMLADNYTFEPMSAEKIAQYGANDYTIEGIFSRVEDRIRGIPAIYISSGGQTTFDITYDPDLGYIQLFRESICGQGGLLGPAISDCAWGIHISDVEVLD